MVVEGRLGVAGVGLGSDFVGGRSRAWVVRFVDVTMTVMVEVERSCSGVGFVVLLS